jgi:hypothetical protein
MLRSRPMVLWWPEARLAMNGALLSLNGGRDHDTSSSADVEATSLN